MFKTFTIAAFVGTLMAAAIAAAVASAPAHAEPVVNDELIADMTQPAPTTTTANTNYDEWTGQTGHLTGDYDDDGAVDAQGFWRDIAGSN